MRSNSRTFHVFSLTLVHGNGNVRMCSVNARKLVVLAGCPDVPIYEGAARSIKDMSSDTPCVGTSIVHGKNGFGEVEPPVDVSGWSPPTESAAQALCRMATDSPGKVRCFAWKNAPGFVDS
jgi:inosine-uridine nucleoside N-ribohydrolase